MKQLYLDNAATTRVSEEVVNLMNYFLTEEYGNPSSLHIKGDRAINAINNVRKQIALELGCKPEEIVFTSGGTESNNLAIQGLAKKSKKKIIISAIEHPSVDEVCRSLKNKVVRIPVDSKGFVNMEVLEKEIDKNTLLVSVMHVNNVFGTIQNLSAIGKLCKRNKVLFHTDAVQSFGKIKINVRNSGIDLLSGSAHKIGGPKGVGFLFVKDGIKLSPILYGGGQEINLRSGTENVPGIIGLGKALEVCKKKDWKSVSKIRDLLIDELVRLGGKINGPLGVVRIANNIHVSFPEVNAENLIFRLSEKGIFVSAGSACDSKKDDDRVLKALKLSKSDIDGSLRISLSDEITEKDVKTIVESIKKLIIDFN